MHGDIALSLKEKAECSDALSLMIDVLVHYLGGGTTDPSLDGIVQPVRSSSRPVTFLARSDFMVVYVRNWTRQLVAQISATPSKLVWIYRFLPRIYIFRQQTNGRISILQARTSHGMLCTLMYKATMF